MQHVRWIAWAALLVTTVAGCATGPLIDNPLMVRPEPGAPVENPVFIPLGPKSYGKVFEKTLDVLDEYFEIAYANRYDGRIETHPRIAPGLEQLLKPGSPDLYQRWLASCQTIRHRCMVMIQAADDGGFFVQVTVFKELEDLPRPMRLNSGDAAFRSDPTVERQFEVIDPTVQESNFILRPGQNMWIPAGRDFALEQAILAKLKKCM